MREEIWKDIPGYEGLYQASTEGRIRSLDKYIQYSNGRQVFHKGKVLKLFERKDGYLKITLHKNVKSKTHLVHRLILTVFDRLPKEGEEGNHCDGDKSNDCISNLEWVTRIDNMRHRINILGKSQINRYVLTNGEVKEIKILLKQGHLSQREIAKRYNISESVVSGIKLGKAWRNIEI